MKNRVYVISKMDEGTTAKCKKIENVWAVQISRNIDGELHTRTIGIGETKNLAWGRAKESIDTPLVPFKINKKLLAPQLRTRLKEIKKGNWNSPA